MAKQNVMQAIRNLTNPNHKSNVFTSQCIELMKNFMTFVVQHRELEKLAVKVEPVGYQQPEHRFYLPLQCSSVAEDLDFAIDAYFTSGGAFFFKAGFYKYQPVKKEEDKSKKDPQTSSLRGLSTGFETTYERNDEVDFLRYGRLVKLRPEREGFVTTFSDLENNLPVTSMYRNSNHHDSRHELVTFLEGLLVDPQLQQTLQEEGYRIFVTPSDDRRGGTLEIALV